MQCNRDNALTASASCGDDGEKRRVQLFLSVHAKGQLDRLARQRRYTGNGPDRGMGLERRSGGPRQGCLASSQDLPRRLASLDLANPCLSGGELVDEPRGRWWWLRIGDMIEAVGTVARL